MTTRAHPRFTRPILASAVALGAALGVHAAQPSAGAANKPGTTTAQPAKQQATQAQKREMLASRLIGMRVQGAQGNNIGEVEDLAVDLRSGQVRYAVLSFDPGFLSAERLVPVPVKELRVAQGGDRLVYQKASKDQLEKRAMNRSDWNDEFVRSAERIAKLDESWGMPKASGNLFRASNLMDKEVQNKAGENIGEIEELVVDMDRQRVHYAMLEFERGWLTPDRTVAVPLSAFSRPAAGSDELVMDVTKDKLKDMKGLTREQRRNPNSPEAVAVIERHIVLLDPGASTTAGSGGSGGTPDTRASGAAGAPSGSGGASGTQQQK